MVDELHNVGEGRPVAAYGENNDVVKQQLQDRKVNVPMTGGPAKDERRGTSGSTKKQILNILTGLAAVV